MNSAPEEYQLGEYRLKQLLAENAVSKTWLAEQISVSRLVLVDELQADQFAGKDAFLADIRVKASVDHPLVGSVYEAVAEPSCCFYAHELLPGLTLKAREKAGQPFPAATLAHLLRRVSEGHLHHETLGHATSPLELDAIHVDQHGVIRLKNLALAGLRTPDQSVRDIVHLGVARQQDFYFAGEADDCLSLVGEARYAEAREVPRRPTVNLHISASWRLDRDHACIHAIACAWMGIGGDSVVRDVRDGLRLRGIRFGKSE